MKELIENSEYCTNNYLNIRALRVELYTSILQPYFQIDTILVLSVSFPGHSAPDKKG